MDSYLTPVTPVKPFLEKLVTELSLRAKMRPSQRKKTRQVVEIEGIAFRNAWIHKTT